MFPVLATVILLIAIYIWKFYENVKRYPKGPTPYPLIGNLHMFRWNEADTHVKELADVYGSVFTLWLPRPHVFIMDYEHIKEAYIQKADDFNGRSGTFPDNLFQNIPNGGVIFSEGDVWKTQRRTSIHILRDLGMGKNLMEKLVHSSIEDTVDNLMNIKNKDHVEMRWPLQIFVGNVITKTLYGFLYKHDDCDRMKLFADTLNLQFEELKKSKLLLLAQKFNWLEHVPYIGYHAVGKFKSILKPLFIIIKEDIKTALEHFDVEHDEPECFVQHYYQQMQKNPELSYDQLLNVCMDFYIAGMETTSTTLRWACLYMAAYPEVQQKMRDEIAEHVGYERLVELSDKNNLPYCNAVIQEIQRKSNIVTLNVIHTTTRDTSVNKMPIPAKTNVYAQISNVLDRAPVYKDPEEFNPSRFLMDDEKTTNKEAVDHLVPFSIGKRQCAGEGLAKLELFIGLVTLVQKFEFSGRPGKEVNLTGKKLAVHLPPEEYLRVRPISAH